MFYDGWLGLVRFLVVGTCGYLALVALLRVSAKRTLAKLNAFDFVVTVALGSTLATVLLSSTVALAEGLRRWCCWWDCRTWWPGPRPGTGGRSSWSNPSRHWSSAGPCGQRCGLWVTALSG